MSLKRTSKISSQNTCLPGDICHTAGLLAFVADDDCHLRSAHSCLCFVIGSSIVGTTKLWPVLLFVRLKTDLNYSWVWCFLSECVAAFSKLSRWILIALQSPQIHRRHTKWFDLNALALLPFAIKTFMLFLSHFLEDDPLGFPGQFKDLNH